MNYLVGCFDNHIAVMKNKNLKDKKIYFHKEKYNVKKPVFVQEPYEYFYFVNRNNKENSKQILQTFQSVLSSFEDYHAATKNIDQSEDHELAIKTLKLAKHYDLFALSLTWYLHNRECDLENLIFGFLARIFQLERVEKIYFPPIAKKLLSEYMAKMGVKYYCDFSKSINHYASLGINFLN
jgi:hypothetical protein